MLFGLPLGLLSDADRRKVGAQGLMGMGMGLLSAAQPSRMPVSMGQAFGQGAAGMTTASNAAMNDALGRMLMRQMKAAGDDSDQFTPTMAGSMFNPWALALMLQSRQMGLL